HSHPTSRGRLATIGWHGWMKAAGAFRGRLRELRKRRNMCSIYGQSCKHASECYAGIAARVLRVAHGVEMKESRPSNATLYATLPSCPRPRGCRAIGPADSHSLKH